MGKAQLMGRRGAEEDNKRIKITPWDREHWMTGAQARGPLMVAGVTVTAPEVFFSEGTEDLDLDRWSFRIDGVMGNAPFYNDHV